MRPSIETRQSWTQKGFVDTGTHGAHTLNPQVTRLKCPHLCDTAKFPSSKKLRVPVLLSGGGGLVLSCRFCAKQKRRRIPHCPCRLLGKVRHLHTKQLSELVPPPYALGHFEVEAPQPHSAFFGCERKAKASRNSGIEDFTLSKHIALVPQVIESIA